MDWDDAFANAPYIPGGADYPERWAAEAAEYRAVEQSVGRAMLNLAYGPGARNVYDLFYPAGRPEGLVVFVHGGYWLRFDKNFWSHLSAGVTARGWACAMPSYTLAPEARISQITREVASAVTAAAARVAGPVVLAGHSAGGQLSARMGCADVALPVRARVRRIVPISPVADLTHLALTKMNADLRLDAAEIAAESPALIARPEAPVHVWVGAEERPVFVEQARGLATAWHAGLTVAEGRHHFDVIEDLADPESALTAELFG
jgi:acetyl esterase/lipase